MRLTRLDDSSQAIVTESGERLYEMIGAAENLGNATHQSLACSVIPPGKYSAAHCHRLSAEILYILEGQGRLLVDGQEFDLRPGDACLLEPDEVHSIHNTDERVNLKLLAVTAPPWTESDVYAE